MGVGTSTSSEEDKVTWLVRHDGYASPWAQFVYQRYGSGLAATGMALSSSLPWLLRQRIQDWIIRGIDVELGPTYVSFGRSLGSVSGPDSSPAMSYSVTIRFGEHGSGGWMWYCSPREWLLQLHKAVLEPVPAASSLSAIPGGIDGAQLQGNIGLQPRWPGRGRHLFEENELSKEANKPSASAIGMPAIEEAEKAVSAAPPSSSTSTPNIGEGDTKLSLEDQPQPISTNEQVDHQLLMYFSNADGHIGMLCLPVPSSYREKIDEVMPLWRHGCEVPFAWGTQMLSTTEDFARLRESAMSMPDLLLFGLESDLASSLTPDWTWEKYPRGFGEVTHANYADPPPEETATLSDDLGPTSEA